MKLLMENWRRYLVESNDYELMLKKDKETIEEYIKKVLPDIEIVSMELIGSAALSSEELEKHGWDKYRIKNYEPRDIDVKVVVKSITGNQIEQWAFSSDAEELEEKYGYDVQLKREKANETINGKLA